MIAITVVWDVLPEHAARFPELVADFTEACRAEPGCLWFQWSRSVERPQEYVLIEAFRDADAGRLHVSSEHFQAAMSELGRYVASRPRILSVETDQQGWSELGELQMD